MASKLRYLLARAFVYLVLALGAVIMAFPFYWMVATSVKSPQEAQQAEPIWVPQRMKPANWQAAMRLGAEGGSRWWGGFWPGRTVVFTIAVRGEGPRPLSLIHI